MKNQRTAQGKNIDMAALIAKNERVRAVGNMRVNARGDTIDNQNRVTVPVTQKAGAAYQARVGNKNAQVKKSKNPVKPSEIEKTKDELELEMLSEFDDEIEQIKKQENKK